MNFEDYRDAIQVGTVRTCQLYEELENASSDSDHNTIAAAINEHHSQERDLDQEYPHHSVRNSGWD